jgi:hypothetical protein
MRRGGAPSTMRLYLLIENNRGLHRNRRSGKWEKLEPRRLSEFAHPIKDRR